jgi:lysophospholipid acyltransferase (LPLAT)-like uncharacterized protein
MHQKIGRLAELARHAPVPPHPDAAEAGRSAFTRGVDAVLIWMRRHARPVHSVGASLLGAALFAYAWLVGHTVRLITLGACQWPDLPERCVLALWHGSLPSALGAIGKRRPQSQMVVLISTEPRGDSLEVLCRKLGLAVIRGDWEHHGWLALARVAEAVSRGACAVITPDGGGPRCLARVGAVVLAAAADAPLLAIGAECRPGITELHKWDKPRNPLPFGRIVVSIAEPLVFSDFEDAPALESARVTLQKALDQVQGQARRALGLPPEE